MRKYVSTNNVEIQSTYLGTAGELTVDPDTLSVKVHDGSTPGGISISGGGDLTNVSSNIIPSTDIVYSIGTPEKRWKDLYVGPGTIYIGNVKLSDQNGVFNASTVVINPETGEETVVGEAGNKMAFVELTNEAVDPTSAITFTKVDYSIDADVITSNVHISRGNNQGIYNTVTESGWDQNISPEGTLWNADGWRDLSNLAGRTFTNFYAAVGGGLGNNIPGVELIMYIPVDGLYYTVQFSSWTQGNMGGGFSYIRTPINVSQVNEGIKFADNTRLKSAAGLGRIKLESSGDRRIEEVYGTSEVSVTAKISTVITASASRSVINENSIWIDSTATTIDDIINNPASYNVWDQSSFEFSLDQVTWYKYTFGINSAGDERGYTTTGNFTYNQGEAINFRYSTGGQPVVWWNKDLLPGGSGNFRGAVIDYHAYSGEATWIGTIHIVDDTDDEHITHTEVSSGSNDSQNDDLWLVQTEGTISYRRIDGGSKTLKVQWSAKVFYGSEFYD